MNSILNTNGLQTCEHIVPPPTSDRKEGSHSYPVVLIDRDGDLVYKDGFSYRAGDVSFTLKTSHLTYKDLSIELPPKCRQCSTIERLYLSLGYPIVGEERGYDVDITEVDFTHLLHVLTMMALKDAKLITSHLTQHKQYNYGKHIFAVYLKSVTGSGTIHATNKSIRWLNEQDTLQLKAELFTTSNYQVGVKSMEYTPTAVAEDVMKRVFDFLALIDFKHNDIIMEPLDFTVTVDQLKQIKLRDAMLILSNCIGYDHSFIIRPRLIDTQHSRVYSVFTSISSSTRELLGFRNYDIGSALQTITLQRVTQPSLYPLHQELMNDKRAFRSKIMDETGEDMAWAKEELSKVDNLDKMPKKYKHYSTLRKYYEEAQILRKEVIDGADALVASRAYEFAKPKWIPIYRDGKKEPDFIIDGKKESSVFFFIWTQYEREIREVMMRCFSVPEACHQVHDAVYSKEEIDPRLIEESVLDSTGFVVKIS